VLRHVGILLDIYRVSVYQKQGGDDMKAKSSYSRIAADAAAKGTIGIFIGITVFIAGFVAWSAAGVGGAIIAFVKSL
jgi:hypothetical protein